MKKNSVLKQIPLLLLMLMSLSLTACTKEEWIVNVDLGEFVLLDEPYKHCGVNRTIRAKIHAIREDGTVSMHLITGFVPLWAQKGETVTVKAKIEEVFPRGRGVLLEGNCLNQSLYTIKNISKI